MKPSGCLIADVGRHSAYGGLLTGYSWNPYLQGYSALFNGKWSGVYVAR